MEELFSLLKQKAHFFYFTESLGTDGHQLHDDHHCGGHRRAGGHARAGRLCLPPGQGEDAALVDRLLQPRVRRHQRRVRRGQVGGAAGPDRDLGGARQGQLWQSVPGRVSSHGQGGPALRHQDGQLECHGQAEIRVSERGQRHEVSSRGLEKNVTIVTVQ